MSHRGLPDAESSDQSWMQPSTPARPVLPKAGYSDFNPPPDPPKMRTLTDAERSAKLRSAVLYLLISAICFAILVYMIVT